MTRSLLTVGLLVLSGLAVLLTILLGGLVHATGSGLACPDWPTCFGTMTPDMEGAVLVEHTHRLVAGTSGLLVWLCGLAFWWDPDRTTPERILVGTAMVLIVVQAVFGGLTVLMKLPDWVSTTHFTLAQLTLGLLVVLGWSVGRSHRSSPERVPAEDRVLATVTLGAVFVQMVLGAWLRHIGTKGEPFRYACEQYPLCEPLWLVHMPGYFDLVYWIHRGGAVLVTLLVVGLAFRMMRFRRRRPFWYHLSLVASLTVLVQVLLGVLSVRTYLGVVPVTLHLSGAVLLYGTLLILAVDVTRPRLLEGR